MDHSVDLASSRSQDDQFATTRWSVVVSAGRCSSPGARQALGRLCETYWPPLYAYVRRRVPDVSDAQDLTQAFFAELLEKNFVGSATPQRGRFRSFLITAFKHFLSKEWEKAKAQKRGGGRLPISLDFVAADSSVRLDPAVHLTPEQLYDRQWALTLLERVMLQLESENSRDDKASQFQELKEFLVGGHTDDTYRQAAGRLGMSESAARKAASRMRGRYRELLRGEIAHTVAGPEEVDDEIRNLFSTLQL